MKVRSLLARYESMAYRRISDAGARLGDRRRLMVFTIAILLLVSMSAVAVTAYQFQLAMRSQHAAADPLHRTAWPADLWAHSALVAATEALALVIAGGTLLVRVCNPFIHRLEESEARVRAIVSTAGDGIITIDERGTIASFNRAAERMFGCKEHTVLGSCIDALVEVHDGAGFSKDQLSGPADRYHDPNQRAVGRRGNFGRFPLEFSLSRTSLDERTIFTVIVRDTTEREAAQQQMRTQMLKLQEVKEVLEAKAAELAAANRELDDFTYIASHDLKEPLRGISSYCQILLEDYSERVDADGQRRLHALVGLCRRLGQLIDDLLTYSQIRRNQPDPAPIDLREVVSDVVATLGPSIDRRAAIVRIDQRLPKLPADPVWVGEVFRNLITNAMKFNDRARPEIEVGCADGATIYVRDNGIGIPACHHQAIFTMFRRLHSRRKYEGTGAGLTFVRKIVEAHGGRVWVRSEPGHGSTFYFTLSPDAASVRQESEPCAVG